VSEPGWVTLGEIPPGTLFEFDDRARGVVIEHREGWTDWVQLGGRGVSHGDKGLRARPLPSPLTEGDREAAIEELAGVMDQARRNASLPGGSVYRLLNRLLWLTGQPPWLRGLLDALAADPADGASLGAMADWLLERGCEAGAKTLREGWRGRLMGLLPEWQEAESMAQSMAFDDAHGDYPAPDATAVQRREADALLAAIRRLIGLERE
jgi:hypothetical protein